MFRLPRSPRSEMEDESEAKAIPPAPTPGRFNTLYVDQRAKELYNFEALKPELEQIMNGFLNRRLIGWGIENSQINITFDPEDNDAATVAQNLLADVMQAFREQANIDVMREDFRINRGVHHYITEHSSSSSIRPKK